MRCEYSYDKLVLHVSQSKILLMHVDLLRVGVWFVCALVGTVEMFFSLGKAPYHDVVASLPVKILAWIGEENTRLCVHEFA